MNKLICQTGLLLMVLFCFTTESFAQVKSMVIFDKMKYNFGYVSESKTESIVVNFELTNMNSYPIAILKAIPSCGCMSVENTKSSIAGGKKGYVRVVIDTKGQKGWFNKSVIVKSSDDNDVVLLKIIGAIL